MATELRLRPLRLQDAEAALAAHAAVSREDFCFLLDHDPDASWSTYVRRLDDRSRGLNVPADRVPATFLAAVVDEVLVGRVSIRHTLNDYLTAYAGHIGYAVAPEHRRRGHADEMLRQGLVIARSLGVGRVLLVCDDDNIGSARVIERNGGRLEGVVEQPDHPVLLRRYWID